MPIPKQTLSAKNKAFWAKPKAERRVAIAKDVIKQVGLKFFKPESGTYFKVKKLKKRIYEPNAKLDLLFGQIKNTGGVCEVCGIGGCFGSLVRLRNSAGTLNTFGEEVISNHDSINHLIMRDLLMKVFPSSQLTLIEAAFEKSSMLQNNPHDISEQMRDGAIDFGMSYVTDTERLIAIMKNIIKNKGTFKP